ncbi:DUF5324 family protein [Streptomyces sp. NPDC089919]|uniref:DUF5324 family protein n=1 Tax=Streptomyces sp. NPDC089919 TaxID=3155188 RepID=UPI003442310B
MTRMDSVRAAGSSARDSVRHAAEVVAPYAGTAKDAAAHYTQEARVRVAPLLSDAAQQARVQYDVHLHPRMQQARGALPPQVDQAATRAVAGTRRAAHQAAEYTAPRFESAMAASRPVAAEAASRSVAALAALKGQVSPREIEKLVRKHERRSKGARAFKGIALIGLLAGGAFCAWRWWDQQSNPDWLVEPPAATEVPDPALGSVDGSGPAASGNPQNGAHAESDEQ